MIMAKGPLKYVTGVGGRGPQRKGTKTTGG